VLSAGGHSYTRTHFTFRLICGIPASFFPRSIAHRSAQTMPSKNETNKTKSDNQNVESGVRNGPPKFVKYRLSESEMEQAHNVANSPIDVVDIVRQFIDEGYKVSCSHDSYGGGTQVFITPSSGDNPNAGWTLSARAPTLNLAVGVLAFKHYTLFGQDWPKEAVVSGGGSWG